MVPKHGAVSRWLFRGVCAALCAWALGGCTQAKTAVSGKVTYKGEPVPAGTVAFYGPDHQVVSVPLGPDGSYAAEGVPLGEVKVAVSTPPPRPSPEQLAKSEMARERGFDAAATKTVALPTKYGQPGISGLSLNVHLGTQTFDIALK